jgi:phage terminase large subunit-like protein
MRLIPGGYDPWETAAEGEVFDAEAAQLALDFFPECLRHIEGKVAQKPFRLEPWQQAVIGNLFGWKRPDGTRRYREALVFVAKKNGKTPMCAGIALYLLACDGEGGAQVYSAAADRDQAALVYRHAAGMVAQEPELSGRLRIYRTFKSIEHPAAGGIYKALSADAKTKHGLNIHGLVVDELHAHPDAELVETLLTGTASRAQPLVVHITTADYERESICNKKYDYACKVRDGVIEDPAFLPVIYEAAADDDWEDETVWEKANPNLDVSVSRDYLRRECQRAQDEPSYLNVFLRLHLNIKTSANVAWFDMKAWDRCGAELPDLDGEKCFAGIDLSAKIDMTAMALYFPEAQALLLRYWIPKDTAHVAEKRDRVPYASWEREGLLEFTEGNVVDYDYIKEACLRDAKRYRVLEWAYDPWNATQFALELQKEGLEAVEFRQGIKSMTEPSKELERLVVAGELRHGGHRVLRWNASNVMVETDSKGNIAPSKKKSTHRIDGIVAAVMAIGRSIHSTAGEETKSVYDERGLFFLGGCDE